MTTSQREEHRRKRRLQFWGALVGIMVAASTALDSLSAPGDSTIRVLTAMAFLIGGAVLGAGAATVFAAFRSR